MSATETFWCPCCGHQTLAAPSPSWLTCPVCDWTDVALDAPARVNDLFEAQRSFVRTGAGSKDRLAAVRPPTDEEPRAPGWAPMPGVPDGESPREAERRELQALITRAFAGVSNEGRTTLRRAYRADYDREPDLDWDDEDRDWTQIPPYVLAFFGTTTNTFVFGNVEGFRYYLPAYMVQSLRTGWALMATWRLDLALKPGQSPLELPEVQILDAAQREAVAAFLRHVVAYEAPADWAVRALERVWGPVSA